MIDLTAIRAYIATRFGTRVPVQVQRSPFLVEVTEQAEKKAREDLDQRIVQIRQDIRDAAARGDRSVCLDHSIYWHGDPVLLQRKTNELLEIAQVFLQEGFYLMGPRFEIPLTKILQHKERCPIGFRISW